MRILCYALCISCPFVDACNAWTMERLLGVSVTVYTKMHDSIVVSRLK